MPTFLSGMARVLDIGARFDNYGSFQEPEVADAMAIASDWQAVGDDIRHSMKTFEQEEGLSPPPEDTNFSVVTHQRTLHYTGPLPLPQHFEHYNQIVPGAANRILCMAEIQAAHRQTTEEKIVISHIQQATLGLWFGFIVALTGFGVVVLCIMQHEIILAGIIGALDLASLVGVFIYGTSKQKREHNRL